MLRYPGTPEWTRRICVLFLGTMCVFALQWLGHELSYSPIDHSLLFLLAGVTVGLRRQAFGSTEQTPVSTLCDEPLPALPSRAPVAPAV